MKTISAFAHEFHRHRLLAENAMQALSDDDFARVPGPAVNSIALIAKHLAGNLASRWTDFLTTDGDKSSRNRDAEFVLTADDTRAALMAKWTAAWDVVSGTLASLTDDDLERIITIRGEPHTVFEALLRGAGHAAYHTGQIVYLARWFRPEAPWLTIAPGESKTHRPGYLHK